MNKLINNLTHDPSFMLIFVFYVILENIINVNVLLKIYTN
jgi:hypothetical protein